MQEAQDNAATLRQHMTSTYTNLRIGIAIIGAALPILLWPFGALIGASDLLASMSAYYHTDLRDIFVGALVSVGVFLYLYKGYGTKENWALNLAGVCAIGVAMVATAAPDAPSTTWTRMHGTFAVALFLCIAYVAIFRAADTLSLLEDDQQIQKLRRTYRILGIGLIVSPLLAVILTYTVEPRGRGRTIVFFVEAVAVWIFSAYWLVKSLELRRTGADRLALNAQLQAAPESKNNAQRGRLVRVDDAIDGDAQKHGSESAG